MAYAAAREPDGSRRNPSTGDTNSQTMKMPTEGSGPLLACADGAC